MLNSVEPTSSVLHRKSPNHLPHSHSALPCPSLPSPKDHCPASSLVHTRLLVECTLETPLSASASLLQHSHRSQPTTSTIAICATSSANTSSLLIQQAQTLRPDPASRRLSRRKKSLVRSPVAC